MSNQLVLQNVNDDMKLVQMFLTTKARRSPSTARVYGTEIKKFMDWLNKPIPATNYNDLLNYAENISHLSIASQARILTTIRSLMKFALKLGYITINPAELLEIPKVNANSEQRFLTKKELQALIEQLKKNPRNYLIASTLSLTGLRIAELVAIRWKDFYEDAKGNIGLNVVGKGNKLRQAKIRQDLWQMICQFRESQGYTTAIDIKDNTPLFQNRKGGRLSPQYIRRIIKKAGLEAGIKKDITPHYLRHTACTLMILGGASLEQAQQAMGHSSLLITQRYLHAAQQLEKAGTDYIELELSQ